MTDFVEVYGDILAFPALFFVWAIIHSLMASLTVKKVIGRLLGRLAAFYRLFYVIFSIFTLAVVFIISPRPVGEIYIIGGFFYYFLKGVQTAALIAFLFAGAEFTGTDFFGIGEAKRYFSARLDKSGPVPLKTDGLMAYSRHPMYFFAMVILWSDPEMTVAWFTMSLSISIYLVIGSIFEERKLRVIYGDRYRDYQKKVRRFLPVPRRKINE